MTLMLSTPSRTCTILFRRVSKLRGADASMRRTRRHSGDHGSERLLTRAQLVGGETNCPKCGSARTRRVGPLSVDYRRCDACETLFRESDKPRHESEAPT